MKMLKRSITSNSSKTKSQGYAFYSADWEMIKKRYEAWWDGEIIDRMVLQVTAPKDKMKLNDYYKTMDFERYYTDPEFVVQRNEERFAATYYGPEAIRHIDVICDILEINAINWTPGAGALPMTNWIPLLKKIQKKGKNIHIKVQLNEIEPILEETSPRGVLFSVSCENEAEAKKVVKKAQLWTSKYE